MSLYNHIYDDFSIQEDYLRNGGYEERKQIFRIVYEGDSQALDLIKSYTEHIGAVYSTNIDFAKESVTYMLSQFNAIAVLGGADDWDLYTLGQTLYRRVRTAVFPSELISILTDACISYASSVQIKKQMDKQYSELTKTICRYIHQSIANKLSTSVIAKELTYSSDYLTHTFKKEMGLSVSEYILNTKIEISKNLLKSNLSIAQVSAEIGFCDQSYFAHMFKKKTGISPREYKRSLELAQKARNITPADWHQR